MLVGHSADEMGRGAGFRQCGHDIGHRLVVEPVALAEVGDDVQLHIVGFIQFDLGLNPFDRAGGIDAQEVHVMSSSSCASSTCNSSLMSRELMPGMTAVG